MITHSFNLPHSPEGMPMSMPAIPHRVTIPSQSPSTECTTITTNPLGSVPSQLPRELHSPEIRQTSSGGCTDGEGTIHQRAKEQMAAYTGPTTRQRRGRVPSYAQTQRESVADLDPRVTRVGGDRVCGGRVDDAWRGGARRGVEEDVEIIRNMYV